MSLRPISTNILARIESKIIGDLRSEAAAGNNTGKRTEQQEPNNVPLHAADKGVAEAGYKCKRHRVGKVGADDASGRKSRVEKEKNCHAERAGADRAE